MKRWRGNRNTNTRTPQYKQTVLDWFLPAHYGQILCLSSWCILSFPVGTKNKCFYCCRLTVRDVKPICDNIRPFKVQLCDFISNNTCVALYDFAVTFLGEKNIFLVRPKAMITSTSELCTRSTASATGGLWHNILLLCTLNASIGKSKCRKLTVLKLESERAISTAV